MEQGAATGPRNRPVLVGRAAELGAVERFVAADPAGRVLLVCGEPGIGKSMVWEAGVELARSRGFAAWCARPGEAGTALSFAGLADLLEAAGPGVLAGLPGPQRHALEVAVRRAEPAGPPPEPLAVAAGLDRELPEPGRGRLPQDRALPQSLRGGARHYQPGAQRRRRALRDKEDRKLTRSPLRLGAVRDP